MSTAIHLHDEVVSRFDTDKSWIETVDEFVAGDKARPVVQYQ